MKVIALCVALSSAANLALALATSPDAFMALRFVQGLAIGGEVPVAATFIAEITRSHKRGRFVLLYALPGAAAGALPAVAAGEARSGLRGLFTGRYRRRTLVVGVLWFTGYFVNYGITSWLPTIYQNRYHLSLSDALLYSTVTSCAGLVGCLVAALTVDRLGRRKVIAGCLGGAALMLAALAAVGDVSTVFVMLGAVALVGSVVAAAGAEETAGRRLEEVSP